MEDYPDPEEEFELMYGEELEMLREQEDQVQTSQKSLNQSQTKNIKSPEFHNVTDSSNGRTETTDDTGFSELDSQVITSRNKRPNSPEEIVLPELHIERDSSIGATRTSDEVVSPQFNSQTDFSTSRKRTAEELFGDIDDLENDFYLDDQPVVKKHKNSKQEQDLALIEHILELRKLAKQKHSSTSLKQDNLTFSTERDKYNLSYHVPKYPFIGVTRLDRERIYIRFHSEEYEKEEMRRVVEESTFEGVMGESFKEVWNIARSMINSQISYSDSEVEVVEQADSNKLWVDLYKPRKYLELLSDESTNRIMLRWIKLWDKAVFNRIPKIKPMKREENNKKKYFKFQELNTNLDEHGRPFYKVALLCGPPGLGKTTLAHMVAKHAGYNVVEVNASDDRSTEAFKTALENATQMRSVVDRERRPNCLVFDEIDGAPQSSIDFLVKFITGTNPVNNKKGKAQKQQCLKRPIICICNDVYVPALRPLRQIAFVVNFLQTSSARLAERLMEIARRQNIKTDLGTMLSLADKSNNDIRSCLSVLHFFKSQNKPLTLSDVYRANVGQKDVQKGLFAVWQEIFHIERTNFKTVSGSTDKETKHNLNIRMTKILQTVSSFGDYERVSQGVFENYPQLKLHDSSLSGTCEALQWFIFSDLVNKEIHSHQNYTLTSYLQYAFVVWHFIFATAQKQKLNYPSSGYEAKQKETRQRALVSEILRGMQPTVRAYCHRLGLILDILPLLVRIIVPNFRPISLHLYKKEEKDQLLKVVNIMIEYNLNYVQERTPEGTYEYNLEPNIQEIVTFQKSAGHQVRSLSYSNKQLIAREIELEKMRKFEAPTLVKNSITKTKDLKTAGTQLPNHLQKLKAKSLKVLKPTVTRDFFGRIINTPSSTAKFGPNIKNDIWYQYKEGYNNAVRKRITISSLK